jgi:hypothetical protein
MTGRSHASLTARVSSVSYLASAQALALRGPRHGVETCGLAPAVGEDLEAPGRPAGVDGDHHALGAEFVRQLGDNLRAGDGSRVDRHLVGPRSEQATGVLDGAHAPADGEGDEDLLGGAGGDVDDGVARRRRRRDVEEHDLVGALGVVAGGQLDRVAGVPQVDEVDTLDHASGVDIEARDHAHAAHAAIASSTVKLPS